MTSPPESATPRTDKHVQEQYDHNGSSFSAAMDFARQLECELSQKTAECEGAVEAIRTAQHRRGRAMSDNFVVQAARNVFNLGRGSSMTAVGHACCDEIERLQSALTACEQQRDALLQRLHEFDRVVRAVSTELHICHGGVDGAPLDPLGAQAMLVDAIQKLKAERDKLKEAHEIWDKQSLVELAKRKQVPDGWKLVPINPTEEMLTGVDLLIEGSAINGFVPSPARIYRLFIAAAPKPPEPDKC